MHGLHRVNRVQHDHPGRERDLIIHHLASRVVAAVNSKRRFFSHESYPIESEEF
jgi:hypothetical protein